MTRFLLNIADRLRLWRRDSTAFPRPGRHTGAPNHSGKSTSRFRVARRYALAAATIPLIALAFSIAAPTHSESAKQPPARRASPAQGGLLPGRSVFVARVAEPMDPPEATPTDPPELPPGAPPMDAQMLPPSEGAEAPASAIEIIEIVPPDRSADGTLAPVPVAPICVSDSFVPIFATPTPRPTTTPVRTPTPLPTAVPTLAPTTAPPPPPPPPPAPPHSGPKPPTRVPTVTPPPPPPPTVQPRANPSPTPSPRPSPAKVTLKKPDEFQPLGRIRNANVTFYDCYVDGFCGAMYNGTRVYEGAAACSWDLAVGTRFRIIGDPTARVYRCDDRGLLANTWADIFFFDPDDGWDWQASIGRCGTLEIVQAR